MTSEERLRWLAWPGVQACGFAGRARHLRVVHPLADGGELHTAACGSSGRDSTTDITRVNCLRCFRTRRYREQAEAKLAESVDPGS